MVPRLRAGDAFAIVDRITLS